MARDILTEVGIPPKRDLLSELGKEDPLQRKQRLIGERETAIQSLEELPPEKRGMVHIPPFPKSPTSKDWSEYYKQPERSLGQYFADQFERSSWGTAQLLDQLSKLVGLGGLDELEDPEARKKFVDAYDQIEKRERLTSKGTAATGMGLEFAGAAGLTSIPRKFFKDAVEPILAKQAAGKPITKQERGLKSVYDQIEFGKPTGAPFGLTGGAVGAGAAGVQPTNPKDYESDGGYWWEKAKDVGLGWATGKTLDQTAQLLGPKYGAAGRLREARAYDKETFGGNVPRPLEADRAIALQDPMAYQRRQKWLTEDSTAGRMMRNKMQRMDENLKYNASAIRAALSGDKKAVEEMGWNPNKGVVTGVDRNDISYGSGFQKAMDKANNIRTSEKRAASAKYNALEGMKDSTIPTRQFVQSQQKIQDAFEEQIWSDIPVIEKVWKQFNDIVERGFVRDNDGNIIQDRGVGIKDLIRLDKEINKAISRGNSMDLERQAALTQFKKLLDSEIDKNIMPLRVASAGGAIPTTGAEKLLDSYRDARRSYAQYFDKWEADPYVNMYTSGEHSGARVSTRMLGNMWEESANLDPITQGLQKIIAVSPESKNLFKRDFFNQVASTPKGNMALDQKGFLQSGGDVFVRGKKKPITDILYDKEEMNSINSLYNQVNFRNYKPGPEWVSGFSPGALASWVSHDLPLPLMRQLNRLTELNAVRAAAESQGKLRRGRGYGIGSGIVAPDFLKGFESYVEDPSSFVPGIGSPTDYGVKVVPEARSKEDRDVTLLLDELRNYQK